MLMGQSFEGYFAANWPTFLEYATHIHNTTPSQATGQVPSHMMFARRIRSPYDESIPAPSPDMDFETAYEQRQKFKDMSDEVASRLLQQRIDTMLKQYNRKHVDLKLEVGQMVYYKLADQEFGPVPVRFITRSNGHIRSIFVETEDHQLIAVSKRNVKLVCPPRPTFSHQRFPFNNWVPFNPILTPTTTLQQLASQVGYQQYDEARSHHEPTVSSRNPRTICPAVPVARPRAVPRKAARQLTFIRPTRSGRNPMPRVQYDI